MYYAGIDYHKHYSIVSIQNAQGQIVREQRVDHAFPELFGELFGECPEPVAVVYESTLNWSWLYEILQPLANVSSITNVARRMCHIAYQLLTEDRLYQERAYPPAALVHA